MRRLLAVVALVALCVLPQRVQAQEAPEVSVTVAFDAPAVTIGDRLVLTVSVFHSAEVIVTPVRPDLADTDVIGDAQPVSETQPDGSVVTTSTFEYQVFTLGEVATGPVQVRWLLEDGSTGVVEVAGSAITVVSVRAEGDEALRPLRPQATVGGAPPAWIRPAIIAAAAVFALGLIVVLVGRWRRRRDDAPGGAPQDVPEASARERLDSLRGIWLRDDEAYQLYYGTISAAVRAYLGERFGFNASALTTAELERRMTGHGVDRWQARLVGGLLDRCDTAVYARRYPDPTSADHDLTVAYEIVELSRPRLTLVEEESGVAS